MKSVMRSLLLGAAVAAAVGCSGGAYQAKFTPLERLNRVAPELYPESNAVLLFDKHYHENEVTGSGFRYATKRHFAVQVLTRDGLDYAEHGIILPEGMTLDDVRARSVSKGGQVFELKMDEILVSDGTLGADNDSRKFKTYNIRVPGAEPGSIIEIVYSRSMPTHMPTLSGFMRHPVPCLYYRAEISVDYKMKSNLKVYNHNSRPATRSSGDGWTSVLEARDLPAAKASGSYLPHPTQVWPYWRYRTSQFILPRGGKYGILPNWGYVLSPIGRLYYDEDLRRERLEGWDGAKPNISDCKTTTCEVQRVVDYVHAHVRTTPSDDSSDATRRPMIEILRSGRGSVWEKAFVIREVLRRLPTTSNIALTTQKFGINTDWSFPVLEHIDQVLVRVPLANGKDYLWVDPGCEYCRVGELPVRLRGQKAYVLDRMTEDKFKNQIASLKQVVIKAQEPVRSETRTRRIVTWRSDSDATVRVQEHEAGAMDQNRRMKTAEFGPEEWQEAAELLATQGAKHAIVVEHGELVVDRGDKSSKFNVVYDIDGAAIDADGKRLVRLDFVGGEFAESFVETAEERAVPLVIDHNFSWSDETFIEIPKGYVVADVPKAASATSKAVVATREVRNEGNAIVISRRLDWTAGIFDLDTYTQTQQVLATHESLSKATVVFAPAPQPEPQPPLEPQ